MHATGAPGAALLAQTLVGTGAANLRSMDLSNNGIQAAGAALLARTLRTNANLVVLELEGNGIGPDGAAPVHACNGVHACA